MRFHVFLFFFGHELVVSSLSYKYQDMGLSRQSMMNTEKVACEENMPEFLYFMASIYDLDAKNQSQGMAAVCTTSLILVVQLCATTSGRGDTDEYNTKSFCQEYWCCRYIRKVSIRVADVPVACYKFQFSQSGKANFDGRSSRAPSLLAESRSTTKLQPQVLMTLHIVRAVRRVYFIFKVGS